MLQRLSYALAGAMLSFGAPLGLLALRQFRGRASQARSASSLTEDAAVYAYVSLSTGIVLSLFGYVLGCQFERLATLSETDPLTGLYNVRGLSQRVTTELTRWRRYREPLAVLLVDVDGLKHINDRYGHAAGDEALRQIAAAIRAERREGDVAARLGGDEFVIVATSTPARSAVALAERVRHAIVESGVRYPLTASFGVAALESDDGDRADSMALMRAADVALYDAKKHGGNAVALAPPLITGAAHSGLRGDCTRSIVGSRLRHGRQQKG
jgi:diguanylate cyclase (GGDEF)-like protein